MGSDRSVAHTFALVWIERQQTAAGEAAMLERHTVDLWFLGPVQTSPLSSFPVCVNIQYVIRLCVQARGRVANGCLPLVPAQVSEQLRSIVEMHFPYIPYPDCSGPYEGPLMWGEHKGGYETRCWVCRPALSGISHAQCIIFFLFFFHFLLENTGAHWQPRLFRILH